MFFLNPASSKELLSRKNNHLFIVDYQPKIRGLAKMPNFMSAWLIKKEIHRIEKKCNAKFDIIWNFDSSRFFNLKTLDSKLRISHIVDQSENKNIRLLNSNVDLSLTVTDYILKRQRKYNKNSFNIGHGTNIFDNPSEIALPHTKNKIKVGYLGNLLIKYLDWEVIYNMVINNPRVTFYFAGPYTESNLSSNAVKPKLLKETMKSQNTFFLGTINPSQISSFLSQMDVLLLTYMAANNKEQLANSHKLMEYLASGRVTIASWTEEYSNKRHLLEMVEDNELIPKRFQEIVNDLSFYNSDEKQSIRKSWAMRNTYESQIIRIEKIIMETLGTKDKVRN